MSRLFEFIIALIILGIIFPMLIIKLFAWFLSITIAQVLTTWVCVLWSIVFIIFIIAIGDNLE